MHQAQLMKIASLNSEVDAQFDFIMLLSGQRRGHDVGQVEKVIDFPSFYQERRVNNQLDSAFSLVWPLVTLVFHTDCDHQTFNFIYAFLSQLWNGWTDWCEGLAWSSLNLRGKQSSSLVLLERWFQGRLSGMSACCSRLAKAASQRIVRPRPIIARTPIICDDTF